MTITRSPLLQIVAAVSAVLVFASACEDAPLEIYNDFVDRTATERTGGTSFSYDDLEGRLVDVRGDWLFNIYLLPLGDVLLELRTTFITFQLNDTGDIADITGEFRMANAPVDSPPLASFTTQLTEDGRMEIATGRVLVPGELSPIPNTEVDTDFTLSVIVIDNGFMCGSIQDEDSVVYAPRNFPLINTIFGAQPYSDDGTQPTEVPDRCPAVDIVDPNQDAGNDGDAGTGDCTETLAPPIEDLGEGVPTDVSGRYFFEANLLSGATQIGLIMDTVYRETGDGATLDGFIRSPAQGPLQPAIASFSTTVDDNGEFGLVICDLVTESSLGEVRADIALRGIIKDSDTMCGVGDGEAYSPLALPLDGATWGAIRIDDDAFEAPPNGSINVCP